MITCSTTRRTGRLHHSEAWGTLAFTCLLLACAPFLENQAGAPGDQRVTLKARAGASGSWCCWRGFRGERDDRPNSRSWAAWRTGGGCRSSWWGILGLVIGWAYLTSRRPPALAARTSQGVADEGNGGSRWRLSPGDEPRWRSSRGLKRRPGFGPVRAGRRGCSRSGSTKSAATSAWAARRAHSRRL